MKKLITDLLRSLFTAVAALVGVLVLAELASAAWIPSPTPPSDNTGEPITIGTGDQIKTGEFIIETAVGSIVINDGVVALDQLCLGTKCRATWPTSLGATLFDSNYCYATRAGRSKSPSCVDGYYMKALMGYTDSDWDGVGGVCWLSRGSSDSRMTSSMKNFLVNNYDGLSQTFDQSYNQIVSLCNADPGSFKISGGGDTVNCPDTDPL